MTARKTRIAINGFGRIGRLALRAGLDRPDLEFVAINDLSEPDLLQYLFAYDTMHGRLDAPVGLDGGSLTIDRLAIPMLRQKDPSQLPWKKLGVDVVLECSGALRSRRDSALHLEAGCRKVVISAPSDDADLTLVMGVNDHLYEPARHHVLSNASCTTNALAPMAEILHRAFGIQRGFAMTVHAYTSSQALVDMPQRKRRRSRAGALNLAPTTTGAAAAVGRVLPELAGKLDGLAVRAPVADGSIVDLTAQLSAAATVDQVNAAFRASSEGKHKGVLKYVEADGLVSSDIVGDPHSCVFDAPLTMVLGEMVKVMGWYDNEYAYSCRMLDAAARVGAL